MDLKTFVAETLTQIVEGVQAAQRIIAEGDSGAAVNPESTAAESTRSHATAKPVEFDVAVFASDEGTEASGAKAGASAGLISVLTAKVAAEMDNRTTGSHRNETSSRIKFTVMLAQPGDITRRAPIRIPSHRGRGRDVSY